MSFLSSFGNFASGLLTGEEEEEPQYQGNNAQVPRQQAYEGPTEWECVWEGGVNVRDNPSTDGSEVGSVEYGERVVVTEYDGFWIKHARGWTCTEIQGHILCRCIGPAQDVLDPQSAAEHPPLEHAEGESAVSLPGVESTDPIPLRTDDEGKTVQAPESHMAENRESAQSNGFQDIMLGGEENSLEDPQVSKFHTEEGAKQANGPIEEPGKPGQQQLDNPKEGVEFGGQAQGDGQVETPAFRSDSGELQAVSEGEIPSFIKPPEFPSYDFKEDNGFGGSNEDETLNKMLKGFENYQQQRLGEEEQGVQNVNEPKDTPEAPREDTKTEFDTAAAAFNPATATGWGNDSEGSQPADSNGSGNSMVIVGRQDMDMDYRDALSKKNTGDDETKIKTERQIQGRNSEIADLRAELEAVHGAQRDSLRQIEELRKENMAAGERVKTAEETIQRLGTALEDAQSQYRKAVAHASREMEEFEKAKREWAEKEKQMTGGSVNNAKVQNLMEEISELREENSRLEESNTILEAKVSQMTLERGQSQNKSSGEDFQKQIAVLRAMLRVRGEKLNAAELAERDAKQQAQDAASKAEQTKKLMQAELESIEQRSMLALEESKKQMASLQSQIQSMEQAEANLELRQMETRPNSEEHERLKEQLQSTSAQLQEVRDEYQRAHIQFEARVQQERNSAAEATSNLQAQVRELTAKVAEANEGARRKSEEAKAVRNAAATETQELQKCVSVLRAMRKGRRLSTIGREQRLKETSARNEELSNQLNETLARLTQSESTRHQLEDQVRILQTDIANMQQRSLSDNNNYVPKAEVNEAIQLAVESRELEVRTEHARKERKNRDRLIEELAKREQRIKENAKRETKQVLMTIEKLKAELQAARETDQGSSEQGLQMAQLQTLNQELQNQVQQLRLQLGESENAIERLKDQTRKQKQQQEEQSQEQQNRKYDTDNLIEGLEMKISSLEQVLRDKEDIIAAQQESGKDVHHYREEISQLKSNLANLQVEMKSHEEKYQTEMQSDKAKLQKALTVIAKLKQRYSTLQQAYKKARAVVENQSRHNTTL